MGEPTIYREGEKLMSYENVKLWFAKQGNKIVTINEVSKEKKSGRYSCPICGSGLKPKAIGSRRVTPHFAHEDATKCNSESMVHWWFKHKFIEEGDELMLVSDKERNYVCKNVLVEQTYQVAKGIYKPDITVITTCGQTIYFEMAFSNNKKIKDYLNIWLELKNIVVEVDIKSLVNKRLQPTFKVLFYDGKCFNTKRNDTYYNTLGRYKEELANDYSESVKARLDRLDWLWNDVAKYKMDNSLINDLFLSLDNIDAEDKEFVISFLSKVKCSNVYFDFLEYKINRIYNFLKNELDENEMKFITKNIVKYKYDIKAFISISAFYRVGRSRAIYSQGSSGIPDNIDVSDHCKSDLITEIISKIALNHKYIKEDNEKAHKERLNGNTKD